MARMRTVHPEQWTDEDFCSLSPMARLLCIGIRNFADDNGIFPAKAFTLKVQIFPADNVDVSALLAELLAANTYIEYEVDGAKYGLIRNFHRFQKPDKPNYKHPIPQGPLPCGYAIRRGVVADQSESSRRLVADRSGGEMEKEMEKEMDKEKEKKETTSVKRAARRALSLDEIFQAAPTLGEKFPAIDAALRNAHPKAKPLNDRDADALVKLHTIDGYDQREILRCLSWLFRSEDERAAFWRQNVRALAPLRVVKDGASKFTKVYDAWKASAAPKQPAVPALDPATEALIKRMGTQPKGETNG